MATTEELLNNVVWLVEAVDSADPGALRMLSDIPLLEMAKHIRIEPTAHGKKAPVATSKSSADTSG